jgi:LysM repeat protein
MISPDLTEIGAGISVNQGRAYFVIDCARPITSAAPQGAGTQLTDGTPAPVGGTGVIIPVLVATPNADGDLIHEVKAGQTLWQIAISYNTQIGQIKRLNGLSGNDIYPGTRLLIRRGVMVTSTRPTAATAVQTVSTAASLPAPGATRMFPTSTSAQASSKNLIGSALAIVALAFIGGWLFVFLGNSKK